MSEARPLITWCLSQGEAAADALSASVDLASLPAEDAREMLTQQVAPVRRLMRAINALAGERRDLSPQQVFNELETIRTVAEELPVPAGVGCHRHRAGRACSLADRVRQRRFRGSHSLFAAGHAG